LKLPKVSKLPRNRYENYLNFLKTVPKLSKNIFENYLFSFFNKILQWRSAGGGEGSARWVTAVAGDEGAMVVEGRQWLRAGIGGRGQAPVVDIGGRGRTAVVEGGH
jgi:hypothetical protein